MQRLRALQFEGRGRLSSRRVFVVVYVRFEDEYTGLASQSRSPEEAQETSRPLRLARLHCSLENTAQARQWFGPVAETRSMHLHPPCRRINTNTVCRVLCIK
jgi:hypothetical protein